MKTVLFIVDMQNDFCLPTGSLYVPGAEKDAERLSLLIRVLLMWIRGIKQRISSVRNLQVI